MDEPKHFDLVVRGHSAFASFAWATGFAFALVAGTLASVVALQAVGLDAQTAVYSTGTLALLGLCFGLFAMVRSSSAPCRFVLEADGLRQTFTRDGRTVVIPWDAIVGVKTERHTTEDLTNYDELTIQVREGRGRDVVVQLWGTRDEVKSAVFHRFGEAVLEARHRAVERERGLAG